MVEIGRMLLTTEDRVQDFLERHIGCIIADIAVDTFDVIVTDDAQIEHTIAILRKAGYRVIDTPSVAVEFKPQEPPVPAKEGAPEKDYVVTPARVA